MNILQIRGEFTDNGPGSQTLTISEELKKRGHNVIFCSGGGKLTEKIRSSGFRYIILESLDYSRRNIINVFKSLISLVKIIKNENIEIVHAHNAATAAIAWLASKLSFSKTKIFQSVRGVEVRPSYGWRNLIYRLNFYDYLFAVCEKTKEILINFGVKERKIVVTYNGTNLERFNIENKQKFNREIREEFGIKLNAIVIGIIGKQDGFKGHRDLIRVFHGLNKSHMNLHLVLVGEGKEMKKNIKLSESLKLNNVTFAGLRLDPEKMHASFDIFALLSEKNYEMFPNAILESLSYGTPFVATNTQGVPETARGGSGIICECGDMDSYEKALTKLITNPQLRSEMGNAGLKSIREVFNINEVVNKITDTYRRA